MIGQLAIGKIRTSYGVRGEVKFQSFSGEYEHFEKLKTATLRKGKAEKVVEVESFRWAGELPLLKFKGIDQLEEAKILAEFEIWVPKDQAAPLQKGEFYLADLIGCQLVYQKTSKGVVTGFLEGGASELLEVRKNDGETCVVPFLEVYLGDIDLSGKTIELRVDWILE